MVICSCGAEVPYIKKEIEVKKPLHDAWLEHLKKQEGKNAKKSV